MMANLEQIIANKNASDTQWQHQQQAERENVTEMQNCGIEMITTDPTQYLRYLTIQATAPEMWLSYLLASPVPRCSAHGNGGSPWAGPCWRISRSWG